MTDIQLFTDISSLPENLKQEVSDFVAFLKSKNSKKKLKKREFGYAKGFFTMTEDFDKPLDDFKDYM
ncbi:type II toxin-antitoxin system VapB family antitoxin [Sphingobacterium chuzhouense]|uniref:DUF2281 domain-containing protein n=1 Tax=Sphingobacterium chuzhouense TaxID=1742264 RepID=A0ABR7XNC7_9SPHI|nr:DUF2281 domain-containing protein [Sphingobacterium chuzhouense]MBD1420676.1 DUF2281 domain-containing protein [Sphingobacterium chuzhouense]